MSRSISEPLVLAMNLLNAITTATANRVPLDPLGSPTSCPCTTFTTSRRARFCRSTPSGSATRLDSLNAVHSHRVGDRQVRRGRSSNTVASALRETEQRRGSRMKVSQSTRPLTTPALSRAAGVRPDRPKAPLRRDAARRRALGFRPASDARHALAKVSVSWVFATRGAPARQWHARDDAPAERRISAARTAGVRSGELKPGGDESKQATGGRGRLGAAGPPPTVRPVLNSGLYGPAVRIASRCRAQYHGSMGAAHAHETGALNMGICRSFADVAQLAEHFTRKRVPRPGVGGSKAPDSVALQRLPAPVAFAIGSSSAVAFSRSWPSRAVWGRRY